MQTASLRALRTGPAGRRPGASLTIAAVFATLVLLAFGLPRLVGIGMPPPPFIPAVLALHGLVMGGWVLLLLLQVVLVRTRHVGWHRRLGWIGSGWALLTVTLGCTATIFAARRDVRAHEAWADIKVGIMLLECMQMLLFLVCVVWAVHWRRRPDRHQRLMLLTALCMWPSVAGRLPLISSPTLIMAALDAALVAVVAVDALRTHQLHPVYAWGCLAIGVAMHAAYVVAHTPWWVATATAWLA